MKPKSDLERYQREQRQALEDLDWLASEDSIVEMLVSKFREANVPPAGGVELAREMLVSHGLNAEIAERLARRIGDELAAGTATS